MIKKMVVCEDGRERQARIYGIPREEEGFGILEAAIRLKGKHVKGEAWHSRRTGIWYFMTNLEDKNSFLLPRLKQKPDESFATLLRSPSIKCL